MTTRFNAFELHFVATLYGYPGPKRCCSSTNPHFFTFWKSRNDARSQTLLQQQPGEWVLGVGWTLDMGAIQRVTKFGLDYNTDDYVVVQNGGSAELVSRENDWGGNHFGLKIEGDFVKYYLNPIVA